MNSAWVTSADAVRYAVADRVRQLGGDDEAIEDIVMAATYAMWCTAFSNAMTPAQSR